MTLEEFLDLLELERDRAWFVSPEGYLRAFIGDPDLDAQQWAWDWIVSAVARRQGRVYAINEWQKAGAFLGLRPSTLDALKCADQRHPNFLELRQEIEHRLGLDVKAEPEQPMTDYDRRVAEAEEDLKAPWQKEAGREEAEWTEYLKKQSE